MPFLLLALLAAAVESLPLFEINTAPPAASKPTPAPQSLHTPMIASGFYEGLYYRTGIDISALASRTEAQICDEKQACGVSRTVFVNKSSRGSIENIHLLRAKTVDFALVQSNVAYMAQNGKGLFEKEGVFEDLQAVASLYPEVLQTVVHADSAIKSWADVAGKRVALGSDFSGAQIVAKDVLNALALPPEQITLNFQPIKESIEAFKKKEIDVLIVLSGVPNPLLQQLETEKPIRFLTLPNTISNQLGSANTYYKTVTLPLHYYHSISDEINTIAVQALLVTRKDVDETMVYQLTRALWEPNNRPTWFVSAIYNAYQINNSLDAIGIPLHRGAKKYYDQIGKRF